MIIGFIGFGKVSQNLTRLIDSEDIEFVTSAENRSDETIEKITNSNVRILDTFEDVACRADILVSAVSPKAALDIARQYGKSAKGIYLDLNNISPDTTLEISKCVDDLVDGAIIGKKKKKNPILLKFYHQFIENHNIQGNGQL